MAVYRLLRGLLRLLLSVFFRHVEVVGRRFIPTDGGVIFAGNHPNSLIDPALIIASCGRRVQFAAKDVLFDSWVLRIILTGLGAIPIRRPRDHDGEVDNSAAFSALTDVLGGGGAMGIFPEGISHNDAQLSRLKTGAARIALAAARAHPSATIRIVPCGLTYVHRRRFRSRALVQFGEPIEVRPADLDADERAVARALTERSWRSVGIALLTLVLYGGILTSALPNVPEVSWESHLCGLLAGITCAWLFAAPPRPARRR